MNATDVVQVVLASDTKYIMPLTVAICSAAANCDGNRRLVFNIVHNKISLDLRRKVEISLDRIGRKDVK